MSTINQEKLDKMKKKLGTKSELIFSMSKRAKNGETIEEILKNTSKEEMFIEMVNLQNHVDFLEDKIHEIKINMIQNAEKDNEMTCRLDRINRMIRNQ